MLGVSILIGAILGPALPLLMGIGRRPHNRDRRGRAVARFPAAAALCMLPFVALFAAVLIAVAGDAAGSARRWAVAVPLLAGLTVLVYFVRTRHVADATGFVTTGVLRTRSLPWSALRRVRTRADMAWIEFDFGGSGRVRIHEGMHGTADFSEVARWVAAHNGLSLDSTDRARLLVFGQRRSWRGRGARE